MRETNWKATLSIAGICMVAIAAACTSNTAGITARFDRPECPHGWSEYFRKDEIGADSVKLAQAENRNDPSWIVPSADPSTFLISRGISDMPEFHDCQKLISKSADAAVGPEANLKYGDMAAVLARENLDSVLLETLGADGTRPIGAGGMPIAEVISEGEYRRLGIGKGFNCLLISASGEAWMLRMGVDHTKFNCNSVALTSAAPANATPLSVQIEQFKDLSAVPAVTRWEFDSLNSQQLIGAKCRLDAWCVIGGPSSQVMRHLTFAAGPLRRVSGWYDEQYLADVVLSTNTPPTSSLVVSHAIGTAYPAPELSSFSLTAKGTWKDVAFVALSKGLSNYESKLGFSMTPGAALGTASMNVVAFCSGTQTECGIPVLPKTCPASAGAKVWARITSPLPLSTGTTTTYRCVVYRPSSTMGGTTPYSMPWVVRWRWQANDETMWVRCPAGCCEVYGEDPGL